MSEGGSFMSSDWLGAFLIIAILFGGGFGGFGGGNAAALAGYATVQDVNAAVSNQSTQEGIRDVLLSSANNNYETARLIDNQTMYLSYFGVWRCSDCTLRRICWSKRRHCGGSERNHSADVQQPDCRPYKSA